MGYPCPCKEQIKVVEKSLKKYGDNGQMVKDEKEPVTLFSLLKKTPLFLVKIVGIIVLLLVTFVIFVPVYFFIVIWNAFSEKRLSIKLPIYWLKKYKKYADNVKIIEE
jgi:hypothetical protein